MKAIDLILGLLVTCAVFAAAAFGGFWAYVLTVCVFFGAFALACR